MGAMLIRNGDENDLGFVKRVAKECFESYGNWTLIEDLWLSKYTLFKFVAQAGGKNLGFATMCVREHDRMRGKSIADFTALAVDGRIRRRGVGKELTQRILDAAWIAKQQLPVVAIGAMVAEDNVAIHGLLKSFGFQFVRPPGEPLHYPNGKLILTMERPLCERVTPRATVPQTA
jgi:ribosomal protein S18 acetylase RimI-like enzyme